MKTGAIEWDTAMENYRNGYSGTTAPLVVKDKVIVGIAGAEYGIRGFIDAYDAQTASRSGGSTRPPGPDDPGHGTWRGTDAKAWEHGGGSIWVTGAYDPELNLVYWGTGNAGPDYSGREREGDNLYTASVVALDADTGKLRWHYQFTPHDVWDWDSTQMPVLADLTIGGAAAQGRAVREPQRLLLHARSRDRQADSRQAVHPDDVGEGDPCRRPADAAARTACRASRARRSARIRPAAPTGCRRRSIRRSACSS